MQVHYVSPSTIPARSANSIHVLQQCNALAQNVDTVSIYCKSNLSEEVTHSDIERFYGIELSSNVKLVSFTSRVSAATNFRIALHAIRKIRAPENSILISRNLYAAFYFAVVKKWSFLYETHQLELGFRKYLQKMIIAASRVRVIVISTKLRILLEDHLGMKCTKIQVLHDAAPSGLRPLPTSKKRATLSRITSVDVRNWGFLCGYFGHLYEGRGIEVILRVAAICNECLFIIFGGNEEDLERFRERNRLKNVVFFGHVPHSESLLAMQSCDALLMPYQKSVAIGAKLKHDTARWMSPMKMFEYLASGVPIISSDLPVLAEVLTDGRNALLVECDNEEKWAHAIETLKNDHYLAETLRSNAFEDYSLKYNWNIRAVELLKSAASFNA